VDVARRDVPYYRDAYKACDLRREDICDVEFLRRLPVLTKDATKADFPDRIVSDRTTRRSLYPVATSGTADRVMLFHDEYKRDWDRAADMLLRIHTHARMFGRRLIKIPPDACYERCGADELGRLSTVRDRIIDFVRAGRGQPT
jgi:phenylacetate-coenzyme A ligase PaaK-like adenylate-forming protein